MSTIDAVSTDLISQHIEGFAVEGSMHFDMPLITHIDGNLWTGGCINGTPLPHDFGYVVSLYPWGKYTLGPDTVRVEHKLHDRAALPDVPTLYSAAGYVLGCLQRGKTLVHCQAGLNRSGLVAGLAMVLGGYEPEDAIEILRVRRSPAVLCNPVFAAWLREQEPGCLL